MQSQRILVALKLCALAAAVVGLVAGTGPRPEPAEGAFPGENGKIAFVSERDGNREIYIMNADGTGQTRLTNNPAVDNNPAWSADGAKIVFNSDRDGNREVYVMNADGTDQTRLTNNVAFDIAPAWSPDGSQIAWQRRNGEVYVMNADGSGQTNLTNNPAVDSQPAWSPDGSKIAWDRSGEIFVMNPDGSGQTNLTNNTASEEFPNWQPLVGVGGIAQLPEVAGTPLEQDGSSGPSAAVLAWLAAGAVAGAVALGGAAWYVRRRRSV